MSECEVFQLKGSSRFEGYGHGGSQQVKQAERRVEELMEAAQAPCSHSIRCLRYPQALACRLVDLLLMSDESRRGQSLLAAAPINAH